MTREEIITTLRAATSLVGMLDAWDSFSPDELRVLSAGTKNDAIRSAADALDAARVALLSQIDEPSSPPATVN